MPSGADITEEVTCHGKQLQKSSLVVLINSHDRLHFFKFRHSNRLRETENSKLSSTKCYQFWFTSYVTVLTTRCTQSHVRDKTQTLELRKSKSKSLVKDTDAECVRPIKLK